MVIFISCNPKGISAFAFIQDPPLSLAFPCPLFKMAAVTKINRNFFK